MMKEKKIDSKGKLSKFHVQISNDIIRNNGYNLSSGAFVLYVQLCFLHFRNYQEDCFEVNHSLLMKKLNIKDVRTFRKRMDELFSNDLLTSKLDKIPRGTGLLNITLNTPHIKKSPFTKVNAYILSLIGTISDHAIRVAFLYCSYTDPKKNYCYIGYKKVCNLLKMSPRILSMSNNELEQYEIISIKKHKLETTYEYDDSDNLMFDRWNNHYFINKKILE